MMTGPTEHDRSRPGGGCVAGWLSLLRRSRPESEIVRVPSARWSPWFRDEWGTVMPALSPSAPRPDSSGRALASNEPGVLRQGVRDGIARSHVDIWVQDIDDAIRQIEAIGGTVKKAPSLYPRPHSYPGERPLIDWAVMQDPFGNEFCLVSVLAPEAIEAARKAGEEGPCDDRRLRAAAGRTTA